MESVVVYFIVAGGAPAPHQTRTQGRVYAYKSISPTTLPIPMRVFSISIVQQGSPAKTLVTEAELSAFGFFQRSSIQEFLTFFTTTIAERTQPGDRQCIEEQQNVGYAHARLEGITGVLIADAEYPLRTAFSVLNKILDDFVNKVPKERWDALTPSQTAQIFPELRGYLMKFQDPHEADPYLKVQKELDETKIILVSTLVFLHMLEPMIL